jgi:hypothetical protein
MSGMAWLLLNQIPGTGPHYKLAMREGNGNRIVDLLETNMRAAQRHASAARPCCRAVADGVHRLRNKKGETFRQNYKNKVRIKILETPSLHHDVALLIIKNSEIIRIFCVLF